MFNNLSRSLSPMTLSSVARKEHRVLIVVMLVGLILGLIYIFIMPPWQHYEEPSHFEYSWLIASRLSLPKYPAFDQAERRQIATSMIKHNFYTSLGYQPDLNSQDQPIWIGTNVTGALPLYHILEAIPLRLFLNADVDTQLYVARLVSLVLYLLTLWLAYKVLCELVPIGNPLRWIVPATMVVLPGFTELMTAVNNDVGATLVFSLFMLASVRMILHGITLRRVIGVIITTVLCIFTKSTVLVALPLAVLAVVLALPRSRWWFAAWALFLAALVIAILSVFSWGDVYLWNSNSMQDKPTQSRISEVPIGKYAIGLEELPNTTITSSVSQRLLGKQVQVIKGKTVTIGAWIWASAPTQAYLPVLSDGHPIKMQIVNVGIHPSFYASSGMIANDASSVSVILQAFPSQMPNKSITIYYDGVILLEGEWPVDKSPFFDTLKAEKGNWGSHPFRNMIRNASAEWAGPFVRPWVELLSKRFPWAAHLSPAMFVNGLLDPQNSFWIYRATSSSLFHTFWGDFAWESIRLPSLCYNILKWITLLSLLCASFVLWSVRREKSMTWKLTIAWIGLAMLIIWSSTFIRGLPSLFGQIYIPTARYAYPAIIPTMLFLSGGWFTWLHHQRWLKLSVYIFFAGFLILNIVSIFTIINFYL